MHRPCLGIFVALFVLLFPVLSFATVGSFRGVIVPGPSQQAGWIWVRGAHSTLRKVEVSRAEVVYDKTVPSSDRQRQPKMSIKMGVEVRVTAELDGGGVWRATKVEILNLKAADPVVQPSQRSLGTFRTT